MESLSRIFGSAARLRLLRLFLFNQELVLTQEEIATRTKLSPVATRTAVHELLAAGLLRKKGGLSPRGGKSPKYHINPHFEHRAALEAFVRQTTNVRPVDVVRELKKAGALRLVLLSGLFTGAVEPQIDLLVVGDLLSDRALAAAVKQLEAELGREIRYAAFATADFRYRLGVYDRLIRDVFDYPHQVLLDKIGL